VVYFYASWYGGLKPVYVLNSCTMNNFLLLSCETGIFCLNYDKIQQRRLDEALRTVLILHPTRSLPVLEFCQQYGQIKNAISFQHNIKVCIIFLTLIDDMFTIIV